MHCVSVCVCMCGNNINTAKIQKQNLLDHGKDIWMTVSYFVNAQKFTVELNFKELPFLDILIKNQNEEIITNIHYKPTDT